MTEYIIDLHDCSALPMLHDTYNAIYRKRLAKYVARNEPFTKNSNTHIQIMSVCYGKLIQQYLDLKLIAADRVIMYRNLDEDRELSITYECGNVSCQVIDY